MSKHLVVAFACLVAGLPAQTVSAARGTLVRAVDAKGEPLPGARVVFFSAPLGSWPLAKPRSLELVADGEGRVRANLDETLVWSAWAVLDLEKARLASDVVTPVGLGRPLRLELRPFPVPSVRFQGLAPWRERFGNRLELAFASSAAPFATMRVPLPAEEAPAVRLPPLPQGNYFPCLVGPDGGLLDCRYFSPHFLPESEDPPEELYERAHPLKRVVLAEPVVTRWTITDGVGQPVAGARVIVRPDYSELLAERCLVSGAEGQVEILLPYRAMGTRGWFTQRILVMAPGFLPWMRSLTQPIEGGSSHAVKLVAGQALRWKLAGPLAEDASLLLFTRFAGQEGDFTDQWMRVAVGADGQLELPGVVAAALPARMPAPFELWLVEEQGATLLATGTPALERSVDPAELVSVTVQARVEAGRGAPGGTLYLCRTEGDVAVDAVGYGLDRQGKARLRLPPGRHLLLAVHDSRGAGLAPIDVAAGAGGERSIDLQPHTALTIQVRDPAGDPVAGASIGWNLAIERLSPLLVQSAFGRLLGSDLRSDGGGRARLLVPSLGGRGEVYAHIQREDAVLYGRAEVVTGKDASLEITVGQ